MGKIKIDLSTEESRNEICEQLKKFNYKSEAYRFFNVPDNKYGIEYLKKIADSVGFDLNYYKEKRENKKIKNCLYCGKKLKKGQKKFCCSSCAAKYNNKGRKHSEETKEKISQSVYSFFHKDSLDEAEKHIFICKNCEKEFKSYEENRMFCSTKCFNEYHNKTKIERWLSGSEVPNGTKTPNFIRDFLLKKYSNKCQMCGWGEINQFTEKIPLQVHHIDGDCTNNKEENLQLLCPNCHSLTETFGGRNKESKRYKLMEYKHGLSKNRILMFLKNLNDEEKKEFVDFLS